MNYRDSAAADSQNKTPRGYLALSHSLQHLKKIKFNMAKQVVQQMSDSTLLCIGIV